jgi:regulatory protein
VAPGGVEGGGSSPGFRGQRTSRAALQKAWRLLARRPYGRAELRSRLESSGFERPAVDSALGRLAELGLVDDAAFAESLIELRARRGLSGAAAVAELEARGVDREIAEGALTRAGLDDAARARELAAQWVRRVARLPLPRQASRLQAMLLRRGFAPEVTEEAVRSVLPPEGWD